MYISSNNIQVFPTSNRNDAYDRNARLTTEQNLTSIINRLTGTNSFVINGLDIIDNFITKGSCNINGYLFDILDNIDISSITKNGYIYFKISIKRTYLDNNIYFDELYSLDKDNTTVLDLDNGNPKFLGLDIIQSNNGNLITDSSEDLPDIINYYLKIAEYNNGWKNIYTDDNLKSIRFNTLKYKATDINISAQKQYNGTKYNNSQDLRTFLEYNYIIDDGEI